VVNAPTVFRELAPHLPWRHLEAAGLLGADVAKAQPEDAAALIHAVLVRLMRETAVPPGPSALGYGPSDVAALTQGAMLQKRLVENAPIPIDVERMQSLFENSLRG
jgi:hydroxyacid-oxoacid transhydrogenase